MFFNGRVPQQQDEGHIQLDEGYVTFNCHGGWSTQTLCKWSWIFFLMLMLLIISVAVCLFVILIDFQRAKIENRYLHPNCGASNYSLTTAEVDACDSYRNSILSQDKANGDNVSYLQPVLYLVGSFLTMFFSLCACVLCSLKYTRNEEHTRLLRV